MKATLLVIAGLVVAAIVAIVLLGKSAAVAGSSMRPPIVQADLQIVKRAQELLDSPSKWNRADNRSCPEEAKTFSLYCALEIATIQGGEKFEHRGAALQEARFVIDEIAGAKKYPHRLMGYNNDETTSFSDIQEVLSVTERLIALRLKGNDSNSEHAAGDQVRGSGH